MEIALLIALIVVAVVIMAAFYLMNQRMRDLKESINDKLTSRESMDQTITTTISDVSTKLGELKATSEQILKVKDSMEELGNLLKPPKLRGDIGELLLETILNDILGGKNFTMQHRFKSGMAVDAAIHIGENLLPIDSKFPLDNFRRIQEMKGEEDKKRQYRAFVQDVKTHIDSIARKYILPGEKTLDFAFMYIPAENVYYETIVKHKQFGEESLLFEYATKKKVYPVSPNTIYPYLSIIVRGLRGLKIEEGAKEILSKLSALKVDLGKFKEHFEILGTHIKNTSAKYVDADKALDKFSEKLLGVEEPKS